MTFGKSRGRLLAAFLGAAATTCLSVVPASAVADETEGAIAAEVPSHGVTLLRISAAD